MAQNGNKRITIVLTIIALLLTAFVIITTASSYQGKESADVVHNTQAIEQHTLAIKENSQEIRINTDHRIADTKDTEFFGKRFDVIEKTITDFTTEQKAVNKEILDRLPP